VVQRTIAIVQDADAVPQLGFLTKNKLERKRDMIIMRTDLGIPQVHEGILIGGIRLL